MGDLTLEVVAALQHDNADKIDLAEIARTKREQKAAKADDADVPEYLWVEHLMVDGPTAWPEDSRESLPKVMNAARKYLLRRWQSNLCREFHSWFERKYHFRGKRESTVEWQAGKYVWKESGRAAFKLHVM
jgi:hypothetical protein